MTTSIVIPNWNGRSLLKANLAAVLAAGAGEVIVVDDGSTDQSVALVRANFPQIKLVIHKQNMGFSQSVNDGVQTASGQIAVLLNSDVAPHANFLPPLVKHFTDDQVFAVSAHEPQASWAKGMWQNGFFEHQPGQKTDQLHISFWASGGSAAFSKDKFLQLGGMDLLYKPFYFEDIDLSYRAAKRGWKILWEPASLVDHQHEGTIGKYFSRSYIDFVSQRNQLIFIWKNIADKKMFKEHKTALVRRLVRPGYWWPFLSALLKLSQIGKLRQKEIAEQIVSDEEIFARFVKL
ncbi:glycosyltransferase [Candidatus Daviesbacteria bacterium]|nr:glycosyltransferase [Candidatus Daviesbacteria bacterium]